MQPEKGGQTVKANSFSIRLRAAAINLVEVPVIAAVFAIIIYFLFALMQGMVFKPSIYAYFNYLADGFLHGQFWFRQIPPITRDTLFFNGHYFLYQGPLPAIVIMPLVAIFGVGINDALYTLIFAGFNVGLIAWLLRIVDRKHLIPLTKGQRGLLVLFFMLGTVHFFLAPFGGVWGTAQIIGFGCTALAYIAAFSLTGLKAWFLTGLALAGAMLSRNHLVFTGILPVLYLFLNQKPLKLWPVLKNLFTAAVPLVLAVGFLLYYNWARFGSPWDNGLNYQLMSDFFRADYERYGFFNLHYIPINLYYNFIFYPFPLRPESLMGGSLFLLSPVFFGAIGACWKPRQNWLVWGLVVSIILTLIPILINIGTGWVTFGPRYTLDFTVPLLLLTAIGIRNWKPWLLLVLTAISIIHYTLGIGHWSAG